MPNVYATSKRMLLITHDRNEPSALCIVYLTRKFAKNSHTWLSSPVQHAAPDTDAWNTEPIGHALRVVLAETWSTGTQPRLGGIAILGWGVLFLSSHEQ